MGFESFWCLFIVLNGPVAVCWSWVCWVRDSCTNVQHCSGLVNKVSQASVLHDFVLQHTFKIVWVCLHCSGLVNKVSQASVLQDYILHHTLRLSEVFWSFIAFTLFWLHVHCIHSSISLHYAGVQHETFGRDQYNFTNSYLWYRPYSSSWS